MIAGVAALVAACARTAPPAAPLPLEVELAGCASVRAGPICLTDATTSLTVWVKANEGAAITIQIDDAVIAAERAPIEDGVRFKAPAGAAASGHEIVVRATLGGAEASFRAPLARPEADPAFDEAEALRVGQHLDEAALRFTSMATSGAPTARARAIGKLARIALAQGRTADAVRSFGDAIALDREAGRISDEFRDRFALVFALVDESHHFAEARAALAPLDALASIYPEGRASAPYYAALVAFEAGDYRAAVRSLREAEVGARKLGLDEQRIDVLEMEADVLHALGRRAEAVALLQQARDALPADAPACSRAKTLNNLGWQLLDAEEGAPRPGRDQDPIPLFDEALALLRRECAQPTLLASVLTNLAHAYLARDEPARGGAYLVEARAAHPEADVVRQAEWLEMEGRIALGGGKASRSLELYDRLAALSARALLRDARWQAALGRAKALDELRRIEPARAAYAEAERLLDDDGFLVPLGEGKGTFLGKREESARRRVDFLVRQGSPEAAEAARRSRARVLTAIEWTSRFAALDPERRARWEESLATYRRAREAIDAEAAADWKLPTRRLRAVLEERGRSEERVRSTLDSALATLRSAAADDAPPRPLAALPTPRDGEVFLVYHPSPSGWVGFAITARGVVTRRIPSLDPAAPGPELATLLLGPFRDAIASATRLRVLPYGALEHVDFHALPWDGAPLVARCPVVYGVDLPGRSEPPREPAAPLALIVADPRGNLPAARDEARAVDAALRAHGSRTQLLTGDEASHRAVRDAIEDPRTTLLHYAGHGVFEGRDGWESGLPLTTGGWLTVGDVLALRRSPDRVLLSGCETARTAPESRASSLGVAQAFILAGAGGVVAATRPIDDALAERLMRALYEAPAGPPADLGSALRDAQLAVRRETPSADWASFRVLVP
ncbi:MAG: CHAT domain-containing protein [Byssovorax sp.]